MKPFSFAAALYFVAAAPLSFADDCCPAPAAVSLSTAPAVPIAPSQGAGHPLRGMIVAVLPEKSALLVKHEEIPGVMAAMTMLLKVDEASLATAKKGQAITALLVKKPDGWWLQEMKVAESVK